MSKTTRPSRNSHDKRYGVKPTSTTPKPDVVPGSQSTAKARSKRPRTLPDVTWELDIQGETLDDVTLASLIFTSGAGQCRVDNFTADALRAIADELLDAADNLDGRDGYRIGDLKRLLRRVYPHIGGYPYEVPDGLKSEVELAADINRREVFDPNPDTPDPRPAPGPNPGPAPGPNP